MATGPSVTTTRATPDSPGSQHSTSTNPKGRGAGEVRLLRPESAPLFNFEQVDLRTQAPSYFALSLCHSHASFTAARAARCTACQWPSPMCLSESRRLWRLDAHDDEADAGPGVEPAVVVREREVIVCRPPVTSLCGAWPIKRLLMRRLPGITTETT
jgi:hypothetical protein